MLPGPASARPSGRPFQPAGDPGGNVGQAAIGWRQPIHPIVPENQMPDAQLAFASATEQLRLLESGQVSASELLELYLDRIDRLDGNYNLVVAFDRERARAAAADTDARRKRGDALGPLAGLPITIKDSFEVTG